MRAADGGYGRRWRVATVRVAPVFPGSVPSEPESRGEPESGGRGLHLLRRDGLALLDGLFHAAEDEILEHLDVFRVDDVGVDADRFDIAGAGGDQ